MPDDMPSTLLPDTASLLTSGGDTRIMLDAQSGTSVYGCRPYPDPELVALGSSTASIISEEGFAAAESLRQRCAEQLRQATPAAVYADHVQRQRSQLLELCGIAPDSGVQALLAASGTDLHLLVAQWLQPQRTVMISPQETGSGVQAAVQGRHFNARAACGCEVPIGSLVGSWNGELLTLAVREEDGAMRSAAAIDADCIAAVDAAAQAGQSVLLILTDVSKTGLIVPGIAAVLALKQRWPAQVQVLVDACQFRLAATTIRAYLDCDFMVALTGSKFMAGPTFCGALLIGPATAARYRDAVLHSGAQAYSDAADWPADWQAARALRGAPNFGLLLRWEAALTQLRAFAALPDKLVDAFLQSFGRAITTHLAANRCFEAVAIAPLQRAALAAGDSWDLRQTIFPFLFYAPDGDGGRRPLRREETEKLYRQLREPQATGAARRFQLGQPVACGERGGVAVSALRLCVSAPMLVRACRDGQGEAVLAEALAALDQVTRLVSAM